MSSIARAVALEANARNLEKLLVGKEIIAAIMTQARKLRSKHWCEATHNENLQRLVAAIERKEAQLKISGERVAKTREDLRKAYDNANREEGILVCGNAMLFELRDTLAKERERFFELDVATERERFFEKVPENVKVRFFEEGGGKHLDAVLATLKVLHEQEAGSRLQDATGCGVQGSVAPVEAERSDDEVVCYQKEGGDYTEGAIEAFMAAHRLVYGGSLGEKRKAVGPLMEACEASKRAAVCTA